MNFHISAPNSAWDSTEPCFLVFPNVIYFNPCAPVCLTANKSLYYTFFPTIVRQPANVSRLSKIGKIPYLYVRQPADVSIDFDNFVLGPKIVRSPA